jgi:hypothetical protein
MKEAEFNEQEYEGFLYNQLQRGDPRLWHPHEVLEQYLGFDRGLFVADMYLWRLKGRRAQGPGFAPWYWQDIWPDLARARVGRSRLPRFRLNCFIQAKRPKFSNRIPKIASRLSGKLPLFRIDISADQHMTLDRAAQAMQDRALFVYAAPAFHSSAELFSAGKRGRVVERSTFPGVTDITGHKRWYYDSPGTIGIRNPDIEPVVLPTLSDRLAVMLAGEGQVDSTSIGLAQLDEALRVIVLEDAATTSPREAYLAEEWREIDSYAERAELPPAVRNFLAVDAFCDFFGLAWLTVGHGSV